MTPAERTAMEMERGRIIGQRKQRESDLNRMIEAKKVKVMVALPGHLYYEPHGQVNIFSVEGVEIGHQNIIDDDYPSEVIMATVQLAVSSTVGYEGISPEERTDPAVRAQRDQYRDKYLGAWRKLYDK